MRVLTGGVAHFACVSEEDCSGRETSLRKQHVEALADLSACAL